VTVKNAGRVGLIFPIYAWAPPSIVMRFARNMHIEPGVYAFAVCTCGGHAGLGMEKLKKVFPFVGAWSIPMPNNYILMGYDVNPPDVQKAKVAAAKKRIHGIAAAISGGKEITDVDRGGSALLKSVWFSPFFNAFKRNTKPFFADNSCTGCGLCARDCPHGAIRMENGKPSWVIKHCIQCARCINRCPEKAIQYGEGTKKRGRYFFKESDFE
ncbi:MAG: EFR1 family ferrodoxin, partial [Synergistaceae bacterium]|nr:EFR1 family ferrodoxin [Synergistaceae bacterium]